MKSLLLFSFLFIISFPLYAQIVAPSLDPSTSSELPSVTSWRYSHTAAASYSSGKIKEEEGGATEDSTSTMTGVMLGLNFDGLGIEGSSFNPKVKGSGENTIDVTRNTVLLGYLFGDLFSIGIGQRTTTLNIERSDSNMTMDMDGEETEQIASATLRIAEVIFLSAGINNIKETGHIKMTIPVMPSMNADVDLEEMSYTQTIFGVGILSGNPGDFQFKAEISMTSSPEKVEEASSSSKMTNTTQKSDTSIGVVEVKTGPYFLGVSSSTKTEAKLTMSDPNDSEAEKVTTSTMVGVGYLMEEGLLVSISSATEIETEKKDGGDVKTTENSYSISIGYSF